MVEILLVAIFYAQIFKKKRGGPRYSEQLEDLASTILYPVEQFIENAIITHNYYQYQLFYYVKLLFQIYFHKMAKNLVYIFIDLGITK